MNLNKMNYGQFRWNHHKYFFIEYIFHSFVQILRALCFENKRNGFVFHVREYFYNSNHKNKNEKNCFWIWDAKMITKEKTCLYWQRGSKMDRRMLLIRRLHPITVLFYSFMAISGIIYELFIGGIDIKNKSLLYGKKLQPLVLEFCPKWIKKNNHYTGWHLKR